METCQLYVDPVNLKWKTVGILDRFFLYHIPSTSILEVQNDVYMTLKDPSVEASACHAYLETIENDLNADFIHKNVDIRMIALNVVEKCNLRCTYCYAGDGNYGKDTVMSFDLAKRVIHSLSKGKNKFHIKFFGGEPLLNFKLIESIIVWCQELQDTRYDFSLTTNGTLLTKKHIDFFKKYDVSLKISYDGINQTTQRLDTEKSSKLALIAIQKIKLFEERLLQLCNIQLRSTITKESVTNLKLNLLSTLTSFHYKSSFARVSTADSNLSLTIKEVQTIASALEEVVEQFMLADDYTHLFQLQNIRSNVLAFHQGHHHKPFCGAGLQYISVSTSGKYYLCHRFTEDKSAQLGSIDEGLNFENLEDIRRFRQGTKNPCSSCWMRSLCSGGCFHENKMGQGDIFKIDPVFCALQDVEMSLALKVYLNFKIRKPEVLEKLLS